MNLKIDIKEGKNESVIYLAGEVDVYTAPSFKKTIYPLAEEEGKKIIVDLTGVNYIDSTGLGIFIGALKATDKSNSTLAIKGADSRVKRLFEITGLDEVIDIESDQREGV